jgi:hypothetical protein
VSEKKSAAVHAAPARTGDLQDVREWDAIVFVTNLGIRGLCKEVFGHRLKTIG